jgi:hypothetical protein
MRRPRKCRVFQLPDCANNPTDRNSRVVPARGEFLGPSLALLFNGVAIPPQHQVSGAPDIKFWRLFTLLYRHRGDVVDNDRVQVELYDEPNSRCRRGPGDVRRLRKAPAGSRYEIVNHPTFGYELIVGDVPARRQRHN